MFNLLQIAEKTQKMHVTFGQQLSEIATNSASMSEPPKSSTQSIPVEEIVCKAKLALMEHLSKAKMDIEKSFQLLLWLKYKRFQKFRRKFCTYWPKNRHDVYKQMRTLSQMQIGRCYLQTTDNNTLLWLRLF